MTIYKYIKIYFYLTKIIIYIYMCMHIYIYIYVRNINKNNLCWIAPVGINSIYIMLYHARSWKSCYSAMILILIRLLVRLLRRLLFGLCVWLFVSSLLRLLVLYVQTLWIVASSPCCLYAHDTITYHTILYHTDNKGLKSADPSWLGVSESMVHPVDSS